MIIRTKNPDGTVNDFEISKEDLLAERRRMNRKPLGDESQFPPIDQIKRELKRGCCDRPR